MVKHLQDEPSLITGLRYNLLFDGETHGYKDAGDDPETVREEVEFAERLNKQEDIYVEK